MSGVNGILFLVILATARDVGVKIEHPNAQNILWKILGDGADSEPGIEILAPHTDVRFPLIVAAGDPMQVQCIVSWTDGRGQQENAATLRLT